MARSSFNRGLFEVPLRRLRAACELSETDAAFLRNLAVRVEEVCADERVELGPGQLWIVLSGWACSLQNVHNGRRQIFGLHLPGDSIGELGSDIAVRVPTIQALSPLLLADASHLVTERNGRLASPFNILQAFRAARALDDSRIFDHVIRLGAFSAFERVGHLMLEVFDRLCAVGLTNGDEFLMPLTQQRLGEMLGLSETHVNRTVRELRKEGLLRFGPGWVALPNRERLAEVVGPTIAMPCRA